MRMVSALERICQMRNSTKACAPSDPIRLDMDDLALALKVEDAVRRLVSCAEPDGACQQDLRGDGVYVLTTPFHASANAAGKEESLARKRCRRDWDEAGDVLENKRRSAWLTCEFCFEPSPAPSDEEEEERESQPLVEAGMNHLTLCRKCRGAVEELGWPSACVKM